MQLVKFLYPSIYPLAGTGYSQGVLLVYIASGESTKSMLIKVFPVVWAFIPINCIKASADVDTSDANGIFLQDYHMLQLIWGWTFKSRSRTGPLGEIEVPVTLTNQYLKWLVILTCSTLKWITSKIAPKLL